MAELINKKVLIWTLVAVLGLHLVIWVGAAIAVAFPNVLRVFQNYGVPKDFDLNATSIQLAGGEHAWWIVHPESRRVIVVCHGRSRGKAYMLPLISQLAAHHNVLAFDFSGHGENPFGTTSLGSQEAQTVGHAIRYLEQGGHSDVVLFGTSMGGASALMWLGDNPTPHVKGIITDGVYARLKPYLLSKGAEYLVPPYLRSAAISFGGFIAGYEAGDVNPATSIQKIKVPGLLLHGDSDPLVPVANFDALRKAAGDQFQHTVYAGVHDEPDNPELARLVLEFLKDLP